MITKTHLAEIEITVGHSCEARIMPSRSRHSIAIRVTAISPTTGEDLNIEKEFSGSELLHNDNATNEFALRAKALFDRHLS